ncbi:hypothetical protein FACS1894199_12360 [Bacteroidia bacterium]|nr:hypothetical protein FACS1894199_12360 [Bacteroidia bacterium]
MIDMINLIILPLVDLAAEAGGYTITIVCLLVTFASLTTLILIFTSIPKLLELSVKSTLKRKLGTDVAKAAHVHIEADINAAIALAVHSYLNELHDEESNIITIKNAPKQYSPWNSKIYGVQCEPRR